ncbi:hypothetical protein MmiHf6_06240 [Methanimicrococcus hongohii]|uniref:Uncharacterized protein n=1 Tax=Methanimicrococcus hongohii TaxID=3028295 RepID=A0AA96UZ27_9EURY|nr:hypothetical protein [Methanimicrococcus sp. Hf6]WNY23319.1 hypothetical protein MmiHf6_06240 [Methanimicrococcus sp. Hf6]
MIQKQKQILIVLIVLLAVVGMIGAGCLNKNENNTDKNGSAPAGSTSSGSSNTHNSSGSTQTTPGSSTPSSNSSANTQTSSSLPDVVVANHDGGSGGGSSRKSNTSENTSPAMLGDSPMVSEFNDTNDPNIKEVHIYVPSSEISGQAFSLQIPASITGFEVRSPELIDNNSVTTKAKTISFNFTENAADQSAVKNWGSFDLNVTCGDTVYKVSFYSSAVFKASASAGGSFEMVEIPKEDDNRAYFESTVEANSSKTVSSELMRILFTLTPDEGNVGILVLTDSQNQSVPLSQTGLNTYETTAAVSPQTYAVQAAFEKEVTGTYADGSEIRIEQNLNSQAQGKTIYLYVPANELSEKTLTIQLSGTVTAVPTTFDTSIISAINANGSSGLDIVLVSDLSGMQNGGVGLPDASFEVETSTGTYNVSILQSAVLKITVGSGCTLTTESGLSLEEGEYNYVVDVNFADTFTSTGTAVLKKSGTEDATFTLGTAYTFAESSTYELTIS